MLLLLPAVAVVGCAALRGLTSGFEPAGTTDPRVVELQESVRQANVVICVIDAARADHLGCYGYPRNTTPSIDRLGGESLVFTQHFCQFPHTRPSTASLFTGQHSDTHLAIGDRELPEGTPTLAEVLAREGFRTVLFSSNPNASPGMGIGLDFQEIYDQSDVDPLVGGWKKLTSPEPLLRLFGNWLAENRRRRFFAYLHFDPPHQPYIQPQWLTALFEGQQPPPFRTGRYEFPVGDEAVLAEHEHPPLPEWINIYDAHLRYADYAVGQLEQELRDAGVLEDTLFIVTADHGEAFGEHGYVWHGHGVYDELTHIPLLVRLPGETNGGQRVTALTQTIDLLPTICELLEAPCPETVQGRSLVPLMAGLTDHVNDYAFCRSEGEPPSYLVRNLRWAMILYGNGEWRSLYDLEADPGQTTNVIDDFPDRAEEMLAAFREFAMAQQRPPVDFLSPSAQALPLPPAGRIEMTPETERQLRDLGYLR